MASVYRKKSPTGKTLPGWYCTFRINYHDGTVKQFQRATNQRSKREALKAAIELEDQERAKANTSEETTKEILALLSKASELAMKKRLNLVTAREILTDMVKASGAGAFKSYTIREWIDEWIETKEPSVTKSSLSTYRTITKRFLESIKERAGSPLESITTADIREFRSQINKRSTASNSNKYIKVLNALFSDAVNEHLTLHNPVSPLKGKPLPETDSIQRHPFTIEDVSKLIKAAPSSEWEGMILLGAYAGLRIRDAANLTTDNLSEGSIILTPEKTKAKGKTVEIPLHSTLSEFFTRNPPSPFPNTPLFPTLQGKVTGGRDGLSTQFATIQKAAKIPKTRTIKSKKGTLTFHSLRHSFVSWMSNAEVPAEIRKKMSGHSTDAAHAAYTALELDTLSEAVSKLPDLSV